MTSSVPPVEQYLHRLRRALREVGGAEREEILSDIRSHILERTAARPGSEPAVLEALGTPEALAEAYRMEGLLSAAAHTTRPGVLVRAALRWALTGVLGFFTALVVFVGYALSLGMAAVALLKPFMADRAGLWVGRRSFFFGFARPGSPDLTEVLGWWIIPVASFLAVLFFMLTTRAARWLFQRRVVRSVLDLH